MAQSYALALLLSREKGSEVGYSRLRAVATLTMAHSFNKPQAINARRQVVTAMSRQAYRLERQLTAIRDGAQTRLENPRAAIAVWQLAAKQAEFGHLVVEGYREGRYTPAAALVRTLFEDTTLLAWMSLPDDPGQQRDRTIRAVLGFYRDARNKGYCVPPDAHQLLRDTVGSAAKKTPSMENRARQLDDKERSTPDGKEFWVTHLAHVELLNRYVHANIGGPNFTDPMSRELLGFEALVYAHQYLTLSIVSAVRLSDQNKLAARAQATYERIHETEQKELRRLIK